MSRFAKIQAGLVVGCLLLLTAAPQAQVSEEWVRRHDGYNHGNDYAGPMVVDHAGNVIVAGQSEGGFLIIKYRPDGEELWRLSRQDSAGAILGLAVDAEDNVYVTGYTYTGWVATGNMVVTGKCTSDGGWEWTSGYDGGGGPLDDIGYDVAVDESGYVYVTGLGTVDSRNGVTTLKYEPDGDLSPEWPNVGWGPGVRRYEITGEYGYQAGTALVVDAERNVYVVGTSALVNGAPSDFVTLKYDADGQELWTRRYDGPAGQEDTPVGIALDDSANVFVAGSAKVPNQSGGTRPDYATVKYDPDGDLEWVALYNGPADYSDSCAALAVDGAGNAYVTGAACFVSTDYATVKYTPDGDQAWVAFHDGPAGASDEASALVVDDVGHVYVTGKVSTSLGMWDYETVKYDASGNDLWSIGYSGPDLYGDRPTAIALGPGGRVHVHGSSGSATNLDDWVTVQYSQDGPPLFADDFESGGTTAWTSAVP